MNCPAERIEASTWVLNLCRKRLHPAFRHAYPEASKEDSFNSREEKDKTNAGKTIFVP